ncbi:actin-binding FH2 [Caulochytrium protostelioides]|uniref:Actin-binding FH2 n=2 Tax=Caulochytrium protostelioides TaxID=1555241 RepID=A0A4P9X0L3_9FUNG|nr:actin-binding FH2 [Caulochytrium protostelioides]
MAIAFAGLRLSLDTLVRALKCADMTVLTIERITTLLQSLPTPDEMALLAEYEGDRGELADPEKLVDALRMFPDIASRLSNMLYVHRFAGEMQELLPDVQTLIDASAQVRNNLPLRKLLARILVVGNYLNGSSFRGNAKSFHIDALLALRDTRTNDPATTPTLLHYIASQADVHERSFISDLPLVPSASRIHPESLLQAVALLQQGFQSVMAVVHEGNGNQRNGPALGPRSPQADADPGDSPVAQTLASADATADPYFEKMRHFVDDAESQVGAISKLQKQMIWELHTLCQFFNEFSVSGPSSVEHVTQLTGEPLSLLLSHAYNIFGTLVEFSRVLDQAHQENVRRAKKDCFVIRGKPTSDRRSQEDHPKLVNPQPPPSSPGPRHRDSSHLSSPVNRTSPTTFLENAVQLSFLALVPEPDANIASMLKPVEGMAPFSKRLSIRNGYSVGVGRVLEEGDFELLGHALRTGTVRHSAMRRASQEALSQESEPPREASASVSPSGSPPTMHHPPALPLHGRPRSPSSSPQPL